MGEKERCERGFDATTSEREARTDGEALRESLYDRGNVLYIYTGTKARRAGVQRTRGKQKRRAREPETDSKETDATVSPIPDDKQRS